MAEYIDKSALVAWLKERIRDYWSDPENTIGIFPHALEEVIKYVDTFEVKEVDLEKELDSMIIPELKKYKALPSLIEVAKHFFELGMRVNNSITATPILQRD